MWAMWNIPKIVSGSITFYRYVCFTNVTVAMYSGRRVTDGDAGDRPSKSSFDDSLLVDGYRLECSRLHGHQMREYRAVDVGHDGASVRVHRLLDDRHCRRKLLWLAHRNVLHYRDAFVHAADVHLVSDAKIEDVLGSGSPFVVFLSIRWNGNIMIHFILTNRKPLEPISTIPYKMIT